jgi:KDO2-lipid IV(A) lauroyltransferase
MLKPATKQGKVSKKSHFVRYVQYPIEALFVFFIYYLFYFLPIDISSYIGGLLARTFGPLLKQNKIARKNIKNAFPEKSQKEISHILNEMWDNLGRSVGEFPHVSSILKNPQNRVEFEGLEYIKELKNDGKAGLLVSGHFGNWEVSSVGVKKCDMVLHRVYRAANNPYVEKYIFSRLRSGIKGKHIPKGAPGAKEMLKLLKNKEHIAILADQKLNDGISVPFFNKNAMTAPSPASFSIKFDCPICMGRVIRKKGARFLLKMEKPFYAKKSGDRKKDIYETTLKINQKFEEWLKEYPAQWLWVHNRWPKE